jgi:hypothetical protein
MAMHTPALSKPRLPKRWLGLISRHQWLAVATRLCEQPGVLTIAQLLAPDEFNASDDTPDGQRIR